MLSLTGLLNPCWASDATLGTPNLRIDPLCDAVAISLHAGVYYVFVAMWEMDGIQRPNSYWRKWRSPAVSLS
jgi:hypothetical protein